MADFEPRVIEEFADSLYKQAAQIISQYVVVGIFGGGVVGLLIGMGIGFVTQNRPSSPEGFGSVLTTGGMFAVGLAAFGALVGYYSGKEKAFELRLKAQQALCQLQIEKNTRVLLPR